MSAVAVEGQRAWTCAKQQPDVRRRSPYMPISAPATRPDSNRTKAPSALESGTACDRYTRPGGMVAKRGSPSSCVAA
eukprot:4799062-Prymnesium_polylepis.1